MGGFYGNITNTSKTQFQFDRVYPNRATMESTMLVDGIYAGRYVLIEYDSSLDRTLDTFDRIYMQNGLAYTSSKFEKESLITQGDIGLGDIVYTADPLKENEPLVPKNCVFWKCTSTFIQNSPLPATFEKVVSSDSNYVMNFNIDTAKYGESRGYDSTVWQKVYIDGNEKYIQIAELNSVVPTFDISADAPTVYPIQPHFDLQSTNVYYKLHWQPQWGMRVKEANNINTQSQDNRNTYPSDEKVDYTKYTYNPSTGELLESRVSYDAAIYYNKEGFDKTKRTRYDSESQNVVFNDEIQVSPTGISGNSYNIHNSTSSANTNNTQPDIQEFKILLPSLGNTISDIWDIIYGYGVKVNADESITAVDDNRRFRDIEWKDVVTGFEDIDNKGGMTRDLNTLAGCINKVHDLMGMIITDKSNASLNEEWFAKNYIYKENNSYYRMHRFPVYNVTTVGELDLPVRSDFASDQEYNADYRNNILTKLQDKEYFLIENYDSNTPNKNYNVKTLNEKSLSALSPNATIGYWDDQYGYEFIQIPGMPGKMATIYGLILQMKNLLEVEDSETRDTATVTGAINALKDIINVFEDLIPGEFLICDANGHVNSANWTTAQDYSYTNFNSNTPTAVEKSFDTTENRWISLSVDKENCEIELKHIFNPIQDTTTTADKNDATVGNGINKSTDDTLKLYTPIVDAMGHVVGKNVETVTLPYAYKTFTTTGSSTNITTDLDSVQDIVSSNGAIVTPGVAITNSSTTADNTQDSLALNPHNKWIQVKVTDDNIAVAHEVHGIQTDSLASNINGNGDTITFQDLEFDAAGHVTKNQKHTYILPYGFQYITSNGRGDDTDINSDTPTSNPQIQADNTQSTLALNSGNRWIRIDSIDGDINSLTFKHDIHKTTTTTSTQELEIEESKDVTFNIPTYTFDEAGHYVSHDTKTLSMPSGYGKIIGDIGNTQASATYDTLTLNSDEWLTATVSQDKVVFSHDYPAEKADTESDFNMNNTNNTNDQKNKIVLETLTHDDKGHIVNVNQHTVTLPYGYRTFKDSNTTVGSTSAAETQDTFIFAGDAWIKPTITSDTATFTHIGPVATEYATIPSIVAPQFGSTFDIIDWHFDNKGHKHTNTQHSIQFPKGSLTAAAPNNSDVVLQLEFTSETGAIKTQRVNIADLKLASYNKGTDSSDIAATDTLGQALSKLQTQISAEETRINGLELDESADEGSYISSIKQIDGQVSFGTTELPSVTDNAVDGQYVSAVSESNGKISVSRVALPSVVDNAVSGQYVSAVSESNGKISVSRAALPSVTDNAVNNQYVSAVNQSNGQISITRANLPDYSSYWNIIEEQGKTIENLVKTIEDLTKRIVDLEAYHNPPVPEDPEENPVV